MNNLITLILLTLCSSNVYGAYISVNLSTTAPFLLTNEIDIIADFGSPGDNIIIEDLSLDIVFDQNILDITDNFILTYKFTDFLNIQYTSDNITFTSTSYNLNDPAILIDQNGYSTISMSASGDGVYISSLTLTGNITVVPLPPSLLLLVSGLMTLIGFSKCANKSVKQTD